MKFWKPSALCLLRLHGSLAYVWLATIIPAVIWWQHSILFVAFTNIYSIVISHASAHHSLLTDRQKRRVPRIKRKV